jgi:16S rRNA (guanine966-N2)-methyltransferase
MGRIRIVAGRFRGRRIEVIDRPALRPTSDRAREGLFNVIGPQIEGASVCDLFAGTGALGFEALSRGAGRVTFVESDRATARALSKTAQQLGCENEVQILTQPVSALLRGRGHEAGYDYILADPPYAEDLSDSLLSDLRVVALLSDPNARLIIESESDRSVSDPLKHGVFSHLRRLQYGRAAFDLYVPASQS